jgi:serine/threonine protein kinase
MATNTIPPSLRPLGPLLRIQEGDDLDIQDKGNLPYQLLKNLGHGASASVEMVQDSNTGSVYARKIFRNVYSRNLEEVKRRFRNEVQIIRRLAPHHHIIQVYATYIAQRELGLILLPVADGGDLASFLGDFQDTAQPSDERTNILLRCFGCLASGLAFMQQQSIRHKDIKPQNILIHQGSPVYTDFGFSYDSTQAGHSTTSGNPGAFTRRYCAPEVVDWGSRNSKSDVFSLGCVYVDILSALGFLRHENHIDGCYYEHIEALQKSLLGSMRTGALQTQNDDDVVISDNDFLILQSSRMLATKAEDRISAAFLETVMLSFSDNNSLCCSLCTNRWMSRRRNDASPLHDRLAPKSALVIVNLHQSGSGAGRIGPQDNNEWVWNAQHQDHYRVTYDAGGGLAFWVFVYFLGS